MDQYFATIFEDVRHGRSFILLLLSSTDPDILRQSKFTDLQVDFIKNLALGQLHRQQIKKQELAVISLEVELH